METDNNEVLQAINRLVEQQTFSLQSTEAIAKLREENATLRARVAEREASIAATLTEKRTVQEELLQLRTERQGIDARRKVLDEREAKLAQVEQDRAVAQAVAAAVKECFGLVFRNTEIRREVSRSATEPYNGPNSYPGQITSTSESVTTTEKAT